jgi:hypothetical protein
MKWCCCILFVAWRFMSWPRERACDVSVFWMICMT